jgi:hypothetical protein
MMFDGPIEPRHVIIGNMMAPEPLPFLLSNKLNASLSVTEQFEENRRQAYKQTNKKAMVRALFRIELENGNTRKVVPPIEGIGGFAGLGVGGFGRFGGFG